MEIEYGQELENRIAAQPDVSPNILMGVSGFLAWLMIWFRVCAEQSGCRTWPRTGHVSARAFQPNRYQRRFGGRDIPPTRDNRPYYILTGRDLSPGQFNEWLARYSGRGRISVYRMRYWRKTVKGKAAPLGTGHEYWRDPLGRIGGHVARLPGGVWHVHLWPGWQFKSHNIIMTKLVN